MRSVGVQVDGLMIASLAVIGGIGILWWNREAISAGIEGAVDDVADAITPTSDKNLVYRSISAVGDVVDDGGDNDSFSLGTWFYNVTHPGEGV